jgi:hypothetical protein
MAGGGGSLRSVGVQAAKEYMEYVGRKDHRKDVARYLDTMGC